MNKTGIEYLDFTWNPMHGCSPISSGCKNCWAKSMATRLAGMGMAGYDPRDPFKVILCPERLGEPLAKKKPALIGVSFMGDLFHDDVPFSFILRVFHAMGAANHHTFLVLTKRAERMADFFEWWDFETSLSNVWLGVTVENQEQANKRIPLLLKVPGALKYVSVEPLLGGVDLADFLGFEDLDGVDWVVVGGESGAMGRPCHPQWVRSLRDQCKLAGIPFMFKQWGEYLPDTKFLQSYVVMDFLGNVFEPDQIPEINGGHLVAMSRIGKKKAGHALDTYENYMEIPAGNCDR